MSVPRRGLALVLWAGLLLIPTAGCEETVTEGPTGSEPAVNADQRTQKSKQGAAPPQELREAIADPGTFHWVSGPEMTCRDGSDTGIGLRLKRPSRPAAQERPRRNGQRFGISRDLVIFLEGGGLCFNEATCGMNRPNFTREDFFSDAFVGGYSGIFDDDRAKNPVADWNFAYVPYCTGDQHAGNNPDGFVEGVGPQQFVGHQNVGAALNYITTHLGTGFDRVLLAGSSAGGVGTLANFEQVQAAFGKDTEVALLNDSGPIFFDARVENEFEGEFLPPELQQVWIELWGLKKTLPESLAPVDPQVNPNVLADIQNYHARTYPESQLGLLSYTRDFTIRFFYSFGVALGDEACKKRLFGGLQQGERLACIGASTYESALGNLRDENLRESWQTFYVGTQDVGPRRAQQHTFLRNDRFYRATIEGEPLPRRVEEFLPSGGQ